MHGWIRVFIMKTNESLIRTKDVLFIIIIVTLILLIRDYDSFFNPQLFAEDGAIFLADQQNLGYKAISLPYRGYYHAAPRLVAIIGDFFPLYYTPSIYCYSALIFTLFTSVFIYFSDIDNRKNRFLFSIALVVVPHAGEVFMHNLNIQWVLAAVLPFIFIQVPLKKWGRTLLSIFLIMLVGFTGPFLVFTWPLVFARLVVWKKINMKEILLYISVIIVAIIHGLHIIRNYSDAGAAMPFLDDWLDAIFLRFGAHMYFGMHLPAHMPTLTSIVAGLMIFATLYAVLFVEREKRYHALIFLFFGIIAFGFALKNVDHYPLGMHPFGRGARYFFIPYLCFLFVYITLADSKKFLKWIGRVGIILMLLSSATSFTRSESIDYEWKHYIQQLEYQDYVIVPIPPGWHIKVYSRQAQEKNKNR